MLLFICQPGVVCDEAQETPSDNQGIGSMKVSMQELRLNIRHLALVRMAIGQEISFFWFCWGGAGEASRLKAARELI